MNLTKLAAGMARRANRIRMNGIPIHGIRARAAQLALAPVVAVMCHPAWAALPSMPSPGTDMEGNEVKAGNWLGSMSSWFKAGLAIFGTVIAGIAFIYVAAGALAKWRKYSAGQAEIGDLKEYMMMAAVLMIFIVIMVTYAFTTIGHS